jgi:hypothetical protein
VTTCDTRSLLLKEAIENLYSVFARYEDWSRQPGCPCCVTQADCDLLLAKPLRELTHEDLQLFGSLTLTLWGNVDDYRHFLPRLFELTTLSTSYVDNRWDGRRVLWGLSLGKYQTWPSAEQEAIDNFACRWWQSSLATPALRVCISCGEEHSDWDLYPRSVLSSLSKGFADLDPFLCAWRDNPSENAFRQFVECWTDLCFDCRDEEGKRFVTWLGSAQTMQWLENGFATYASREWIGEFESTLYEIRRFIKTGTD